MQIESPHATGHRGIAARPSSSTAADSAVPLRRVIFISNLITVFTPVSRPPAALLFVTLFFLLL